MSIPVPFTENLLQPDIPNEVDKVCVVKTRKQSTGEKAFSGYDVKFSGQAPYLPWAKIKGTYYHWDTISGPDIFIITLYPSKCT
jgi:hypothetical protein